MMILIGIKYSETCEQWNLNETNCPHFGRIVVFSKLYKQEKRKKYNTTVLRNN